jgi:hypothetical protein
MKKIKVSNYDFFKITKLYIKYVANNLKGRLNDFNSYFGHSQI